jgi:phosphoserine phosphatase/lysophospholipase L1-like esterase
MTIQTHPDSAADRDPSRREPPSSGSGILLPAVALAALTGAVLWFGLSPDPALRPAGAAKEVARSGSAVLPAAGANTGSAAGSVAGSAFGSAASQPASAPAAKAVTIDQLPSWNDGATKQAILDFVDAVTRPGGPTFVPVPERVAVFDNDGTLVCEKPIVHGMFLLDRVKALAARQPELAHEEPFTTLLTGDIEFIRRLGKKYLLDVMFTTLAGIPEERLEDDTRSFLATARHPVFDVPYADVTYQPMQELMALLRSHDFSVWICSGSGVHFMRPAAEAWYGIGPEHVIASRPVSEMREVEVEARAADGSSVRGLELVVMPSLHVLNDEERKPVSIGEHVGRRPIFAAGNVGTTGDIEMLRWSQSSRHPSLQLLVLHDDADREMAYGEASNDSLEAAKEYGWNVVSMASDWNRVFAKPLAKQAAVQPSPAAVQPSPAAVQPSPAAVQPSPAATAAIVPNERWEKEIADFEQADRDQPPAQGGVVFLGSSNIRMWTTMADDFASLNPINRGLGGARLSELAPIASRLVAATRPRVVVVSAGSNDIANGSTAGDVRTAFAAVAENLRRDQPELRVAFLAIAPSILRWEQWDRQQEANAAVREFVESQGSGSGLSYIDANAALLDGEGRPAVECFLDDRQHPSTIGNSRRAAIMRPLLHELSK